MYKKDKDDEAPSVWIGLSKLIAKVLAGVAVIVFMSLVFVFLHDLIMQCTYFRANTVNIVTSGTEHLTPRQIEQISHIEKGVNILSVNLKMAHRRLLSNPWIEKAYIRRDYPSTITIRIKEHHPLAMINFGGLYLIDEKGKVFTEISKSESYNLPVITGVDYLDWTGDKGSTGDSRSRGKMFKAVMEVLKLGQQKGAIVPDKKIEEIDVDKDIGLTLRTTSPVELITLGYGHYKEKYKRLARLLSYLSQNAQYPKFYSMNLTNPDRIVAEPEKFEKTTTPEKKEA